MPEDGHGIPRRMRAVRYDRYGGPERLRLVETAIPTPAPGEVLVRVRASSVDSWDWDQLRGRPWFVRVGAWRRPAHRVLGADVAGEVVAVGEAAGRFRMGDAVWGDLSSDGWGCFAEFATAPETAIAPQPPAIGWAAAAAVPQAGGLAWQALVDAGSVQPGDRVLVNGAGGGAGTIAVQLARHLGAEVTAVDRSGKADLLRTLGATTVLDAERDDYTATGEQYDVVVDLVATRPVGAYRRALAPGGRFVAVGGSTPTIAAVFARGRRDERGTTLRLLAAHPNGGLAELGALVASGTIAPVIDEVLPLERVAEALARIGAGDVRGKLVIDPWASEPRHPLW